MPILIDQNESAIRRGIKLAGIGKKGSKPLDAPLAAEILAELKEGLVSPAARGAFFAALFLKGITPAEMILEQAFPAGALHDPQRLAEALCSDAPELIRKTCAQLLAGQELNKDTAYRLGQFLFSSQPGDGARGLVASALRVRYETPDEYEGILAAAQEKIEPVFRSPVPKGDPIIQLSEPFDGVDHSHMITPLVAAHLQKHGFRAINMVGRNSGPKLDMNLLDVAKELDVNFVHGNQDLGQSKPRFGWCVRQQDLSKAIDRWVEIRHETIKRPFLATLEKFLNPVSAQIIITSAFHLAYTEKMITISERAGFPGAIVIRNGMEGTMAFPLKRVAKIMCSARQKDGSYLRHEFDFDPVQYMGFEVSMEERLERPSAVENAQLISAFIQSGKTGNELFDLRVRVTCAGIMQAVEWIQKNIQ